MLHLCIYDCTEFYFPIAVAHFGSLMISLTLHLDKHFCLYLHLVLEWAAQQCNGCHEGSGFEVPCACVGFL